VIQEAIEGGDRHGHVPEPRGLREVIGHQRLKSRQAILLELPFNEVGATVPAAGYINEPDDAGDALPVDDTLAGRDRIAG
jgi:hypothetical protein